VLLVLSTLVGAVDVQFRSAVATATTLATATNAHAKARTHTKMSKRSRSKAKLRGLGSDAEIAGDDNNDDDDDDQEDENGQPAEVDPMAATGGQAQPVMTLNSRVKSAGQSPDAELAAEEAAEDKKAAEEAEADREKAAAQVAKVKADADRKDAAVKAAKKGQSEAKQNVNSFKDDQAFDAKIATETKLLTNETQSPTLASFLGELRTEVRQYAKPSYPAYLEAKLDAADKKVELLEAELNNKQALAPVKAEVKKEKPEKAEKEAKKPETKEASGGNSLAERKAGETFAVSFFATVALLSVVFAMASAEDKIVRNYTWFLMDQVTAIFLAVMYFQAFDSLLDFHGLGFHSQVACSILHALIVMAIVLGAAAALRKQKLALAILCSAGAHIVSFSSIHASAAGQNAWVGYSYSYMMCMFGLGTLFVALAGIGYLLYTAKRSMSLAEDLEYMEKADDVENDAASMALSVCFTMLVRFIISGHHPAGDEAGFAHTQSQRNAMGFYAIVCFIIAVLVTGFCAKKAADPTISYGGKRLCTFATTVTTMNVAWALLFWGEWEFFEAIYPGEAIKGRLMFTIAMTLLGGVGLIVLSKISSSSDVKTERKAALVAISLVIATSWELVFDASVEAMCDGVSHPALWKIAMTLILGAIVLPVYGLYMKPVSSKAAEAIGA